MSKTKEALEMAIEAMEWEIGGEPLPTLMVKALEACKDALAEPAQSITEGATMFKQVGNSSKPPSPLPPIHTCIYSRTMNQEYPRKYIQYGKVEALGACKDALASQSENLVEQKPLSDAEVFMVCPYIDHDMLEEAFYRGFRAAEKAYGIGE